MHENWIANNANHEQLQEITSDKKKEAKANKKDFVKGEFKRLALAMSQLGGG